MARDESKPEPDEAKPRGGSQEPPTDSPAGRRPLSEDEKIDEALDETFVASDPPANSAATRVGAPKRPPANKKTTQD